MKRLLCMLFGCFWLDRWTREPIWRPLESYVGDTQCMRCRRIVHDWRGWV